MVFNKPTKLQFQRILTKENLMLSKRYESTEVDRRTWLHVHLAKKTQLPLSREVNSKKRLLLR